MKKIILGLVLASFLLLPVVLLAEAPTVTPITALGKIRDALYSLLLIIATIFIILAAFNFITAAGDPEKVKTARNYVIYALVGVIVAVLARGFIDYIKTTLGA